MLGRVSCSTGKSVGHVQHLQADGVDGSADVHHHKVERLARLLDDGFDVMGLDFQGLRQVFGRGQHKERGADLQPSPRATARHPSRDSSCATSATELGARWSASINRLSPNCKSKSSKATVCSPRCASTWAKLAAKKLEPLPPLHDIKANTCPFLLAGAGHACASIAQRQPAMPVPRPIAAALPGHRTAWL